MRDYALCWNWEVFSSLHPDEGKHCLPQVLKDVEERDLNYLVLEQSGSATIMFLKIVVWFWKSVCRRIVKKTI